MRRQVQILLRIALLLLLASVGAGKVCAQISTNPASVNFGSVALGLQGGKTLLVTNNGSSSATVLSFTFSQPQFGMTNGVFPRTLSPHQTDQWSIGFRPSVAQSYSGTLTINLTGGSTVSVPLSGIGIINAGIPTVSASSISFGNLALGSTASQTVTVTNTGTASFSVTSVTTYQPFAVTGFSNTVTLKPNQSLSLQVSYSAANLGAVTGAVTISYSSHPPSGIDLTGTGTLPSGLAITSYPTLPAATQGASYLATLQATGGTPPYTWGVKSGNVQGLTFSSSGAFSGSVATSVTPGNYLYSVQVQDSNVPPRQASAAITLPVGAPTGANCNLININVTGTQNPVIALNDLGAGAYQGYQGGLYPSGSNADPADHQSAAITLAQTIQPLDASGNPDPNGVYVLLALGESATQQPFSVFLPAANADPSKNPHLVIVNGALGGETAKALIDSNSNFLNTIIDYLIPFAGVTQYQVVAAWVDAVDSNGLAFPGDAQQLQSEIETLAQKMHQLFPNLALAYYGSLNYTGYSQGVSSIDPEPQGYETGFGDKWAIQDQLNGDPNLNFNPQNGPVMAPWMGWGDYYWANGLLARTDGTTWSCQDLKYDGTHPVYPGGQLKIAHGLLNFFKTDPTTTPWFLAPGGKANE